jgi:hypothetical protein
MRSDLAVMLPPHFDGRDPVNCFSAVDGRAARLGARRLSVDGIKRPAPFEGLPHRDSYMVPRPLPRYCHRHALFGS